MQEVSHHPWVVLGCQELVVQAGVGEHSCSACPVLPEVYRCCSVVTGVGVLSGREGGLLGPEKEDLSLFGLFTPKHSPW